MQKDDDGFWCLKFVSDEWVALVIIPIDVRSFQYGTAWDIVAQCAWQAKLILVYILV